jgi:hypothetical protein
MPLLSQAGLHFQIAATREADNLGTGAFCGCAQPRASLPLAGCDALVGHLSLHMACAKMSMGQEGL